MKRTGQILVELLLAAIFLVMFVPVVQKWSQDLGGQTTLHQAEQEAAQHNQQIYGGH